MLLFTLVSMGISFRWVSDFWDNTVTMWKFLTKFVFIKKKYYVWNEEVTTAQIDFYHWTHTQYLTDLDIVNKRRVYRYILCIFCKNSCFVFGITGIYISEWKWRGWGDTCFSLHQNPTWRVWLNFEMAFFPCCLLCFVWPEFRVRKGKKIKT